MSIEQVGYGAGERDFPSTPNVLRILVGRAAADAAETDRVTVIECEIDDMNPQIFGVVMDRLYAAGALEVFYVPIQMKKNRPGTLLTVIAPPALRPAIADIVFRETTTIGLRHYEVDRECLRREIVTVETPVGAVRFKVAWRDGRVVNAAPEFEDCVQLAAAANLSGQGSAGAGGSGLPARSRRREPILPDHRHRLRQQPAASRARRTRRSAPTSSRATSGSAASTRTS